MSKFKAVVFDWAGTVIDFGSFAPVAAFIRAFAGFGIELSEAQARAPMGAPKIQHIQALLADEQIAVQWQQKYGQFPRSFDVDRIYEAFVPINAAIAADYATLVPGAAAAVASLRESGLKIGSTTGYTRSIMNKVLAQAAAQGFSPDNLVCADDLPETRPGPLGMYQCFIDLRVYPPEQVLKIDDTAPGIAEGRSAGCITVGVMLSGNECGKTPAELASLSADEIKDVRLRAGNALRAAGADHVIDTVADLPALLSRLDS